MYQFLTSNYAVLLVWAQNVIFLRVQQGTLIAMPLRDGSSASDPKPQWTPEATTSLPTFNGEMLTTRLIEVSL